MNIITIIEKIGDAILLILAAWVPGAPLLDNVVNLIVSLSNVTNLGSSPFMQAVLKIAVAVEAGAANLNGPQGWTDVGSETIEGVAYTAIIVNNASPLGQQLGL